MGKRKGPETAEEEQQKTKRLKLHEVDRHQNQNLDDIKSSKDLQYLLSFHQDDSVRLRFNLQKFRHFLESVGVQLSRSSDSEKASLLLEFLKSATPPEDDQTSDSLPGLLQAWSFASQTKEEGLLSVIPTVLALLLKTISNAIEFQAVGNRLCRSILKKDNITSLDAGLSAPKTKHHLIVPCLRLLSEIVSFDGGSNVCSLYELRDITLKRLDVFLNLQSSTSGFGKKTSDVSVRSCALQYILLNIRYQDKVAKTDLLSQPKVIRQLFHNIAQDSANSISDLLITLKKHVLLDETISKTLKSRIFTDTNLKQIASLYHFQQSIQTSNNQSLSVPELTHQFLLSVCTSKQHGILFKQHGWYNSDPGNDASTGNVQIHDLPALREPQESLGNKTTVKNIILASFLQALRPWAHVREKELALAIFKAAPELVADYFRRRQALSFDPKLSLTWVGYTVFLSSVINLPIPVLETFSRGEARAPPAVSIVMESVLPALFTRKIFIRCLNQTSTLIKLFTVRLLIAAFQKLEELTSLFNSNKVPSPWSLMLESVVLEFQTRIPDLIFVVNVFRSCSEEQSILRDALVCLIVLYHKVVPQAVGGYKFDALSYLSSLLHTRQPRTATHEDTLPLFELNCLLEIASHSFETRWWQKPDKWPLSPFTSVVQLVTQSKSSPTVTVEILQSVVKDHSILQHDVAVKSLLALLQSFYPSTDWAPDQHVFEFLDNCVLRFVQKPVKYFGDAQDLIAACTNDRPVSNLFLVLAEQWPFFVKDHRDAEIINLGSWISRYLKLAAVAGENDQALQVLCHRMQSSTESEEARLALKGDSGDEKFEQTLSAPKMSSGIIPAPQEVYEAVSERSRNALDRKTSFLEQKLRLPPEPEDYPSLATWLKRDIADAVEDFDVGNLLLYLSSEHSEVRRQAVVQLRTLMARLESSGYSNWQQVYLLVGILIQTAEGIIATEPLPSIATVIAARLTLILHDPLHFLYAKANEFLNRSPIWTPSKLPSYWIDKIFLLPPDRDEAHHKEVQWLLESLIQGLRSQNDLNLYRRGAVFERVMSLAGSPRTTRACFEQVIHLLYRCTLIGGATTLITRCGVLGWIQEKMASRASDELSLKALNRSVHEMCDRRKGADWSDDYSLYRQDRESEDSTELRGDVDIDVEG